MPQESHGVDRRRLLSRLGGDFQLEAALRTARSTHHDVITILTFLEISRTNVRAVTTSREVVAEPYEGVPGVLPDHQRAPVSVYSVARSLGLPYETVRRHVKKLIADGLCESVDGGLIIPASVILRPGIRATVEENWRATVAFVQTAGQLGVSATDHFQPPGPDHFQQVIRVVTDFCLDATCHMARTMGMDPMSAILLRAVNLANVRHVTQDPALALTYAGLDEVPDDSERRPVSVYSLSKFLALPYETTRRALGQLEAQGLVRRAGRGLIVPAEVVTRPDIVAGILELVAMTETLLADLAAAGLAYQPET